MKSEKNAIIAKSQPFSHIQSLKTRLCTSRGDFIFYEFKQKETRVDVALVWQFALLLLGGSELIALDPLKVSNEAVVSQVSHTTKHDIPENVAGHQPFVMSQKAPQQFCGGSQTSALLS